MTAQTWFSSKLDVAQCGYDYPLLPTRHCADCANCAHHSDTVVTHFCPTSSLVWASGQGPGSGVTPPGPSCGKK